MKISIEDINRLTALLISYAVEFSTGPAAAEQYSTGSSGNGYFLPSRYDAGPTGIRSRILNPTEISLKIRVI